MKIDLLQSTAMSKQAVKSRTESEQEIMKTPSSVRPVGQAGMHARLGLFTPPKLVIISAQPYHTHPDSSSNAPLLTSDLLQEPQNDPNDNKDAAPPVIPDCIIQELYQIGFFNPDYKAPENIQRFTRNRDGFYVYWDVFAFTARVQQHIRTKESRKEDLEALSQVLPYCLQKSAWTWWDQEVEEHRKEIFMSVPAGIDLWYKHLEARFEGTGKKLPQGARSSTNRVATVKGKKGKPEKLAFWDQKKGETLDECSIRRRKAGS